ncbi:MAG: NAD(P) transhydrogenase subunit alpha [Puniceicoccales bacterium]|nr:NAD(P) transhydrogenase subunit alpha [Puniceicoccales bacterium]
MSLKRMQIFIPREIPEETRVAATPDTVEKFKKLGIEVCIEEGVGKASFYSDEAYRLAGACIIPNEQCLQQLERTDCILHVLPLDATHLSHVRENAWHISFFDAFNYASLFDLFKQRKLNVISLERIPRISLTQKMDALSSQSSLAGYVAVIQGASHLMRTLPMMVTPAGTLQAVRVFVIGVGVAGLQAIATAKRLGARVEAFDTRPEVEEQVHSLGAKFLKIDLGKTESTSQGYAKALTEEQLNHQRQWMARACSHADIVITTAKVFGRKAPLILTQSIIDQMHAGSVIVDLAVEVGGNTEGLIPGKNVMSEKGVFILGEGYWERKVATAASQMLAANLYAFVEHFWASETNCLKNDAEDDILKSCMCIKAGKVRF